MKHLLLIGAGFSSNWNAPLASQVRGSLLSDLKDDARLAQTLTQASQDGNFEAALAQIQSEYRSNPNSITKGRLDRFQSAVENLFSRINQALAATPLEFHNDKRFSVTEFLSRFDAIFSLNQDLLLEMHYDPQLSDNRRWDGFAAPGMRPLPADVFLKPYNKRWAPGPSADFVEGARIQPHFKLHGSSQWFDADGNGLLIIGGEKLARIKEHAVLYWYHDRFRWHLSQGGARLMVVGYSFRDPHINETLYEAWQRTPFEIYIVDPVGLEVRNPDRHLPLHWRGPLEDIVAIGETTLPVKHVFSGNEFALNELLRFFTS
jgi:hypothetical protein